MHIEDGVLYIDEYAVELEKSDKDVNIYVYFVEEGYRDDDNTTHEVHQDHDPYSGGKEGFTFLGSLVNPADPELRLISRKKELVAHLLTKTDLLASKLKEGYSELEERSWEVQESEARALLAVKTPTIDALCAVRGCSRDYLAAKIVENADAARSAGIGILSWQQETEEKIKTMTLEEFSVMWEAIEDKSLS